MSASPAELFKKVKNLALRFRNDYVHELAKAYEEYLNSLPEWAQNVTILTFSGKQIKRKDIPRLLVEDPQFREWYIKILTES